MKKTILGICLVALSACSKQETTVSPDAIDSLLKSGNYQAAVLSLRTALTDDPSNTVIRELLAKSYLQQGKYLFAEKEIFNVLDNNKDISVNTLEIAFEIFLLTENYSAFDKYTKSTSLPTSTRITELSFLAGLDNSSDIENGNNKILKALNRGQNNELIASISDVAPNQENYIYLYSAAVKLMNAGKYKESFSLFENLISVRPEDDNTTVYAMLSSYRSGLLEKATGYAKQLAAKNENNAIAEMILAADALQHSKYETAKNLAEKAFAKGLNAPDLRLISGIANFHLGYFEQAYNQFEKIKSLISTQHPAYKYITATELELGMLDDVQRDFKSIKINDDTAYLALRLSEQLSNNNQSVAANSIMSQLTNAELSDSNIKFYIDGVLTSQGKLSEEDLSNSFNSSSKTSSQKSLYISALLSTKSYEKALSEVDSWLEDSPNSVEYLLLKSAIYLKSNDTTAAESVINKILTIEPENLSAHLYFANKDLFNENYDTALGAFKDIAKSHFYSREATVGIVRSASQIGKLSDEIKWLLMLFNKENGISNDDATFQLSFLLASTDQITEAKNLLDRWKTKQSGQSLSDNYYELLAAILAYENKMKDVSTLIKQWQSDKGYSEALINFALRYYERTSDWSQGLVFVKNALSAHPANYVPRLPLMEAYFLVRSGETDAAKTKLAALKQAFSNNYYWKKSNALVLATQGKNHDALTVFKELYEESPSTENALLILRTAVSLKDSISINEIADKHLTENPNDLNFELRYAEWLLVNNPSKAIDVYESMVQRNANSATVFNNLAWLLGNKGSYNRAIEYAKRAFGLAPNKIYVADTLANLYIANNQKSDAIELVSDFYQKSQKEFNAGILYANTLAELNEKEQAKFIVSQLSPRTNNEKDKLNIVLSKLR